MIHEDLLRQFAIHAPPAPDWFKPTMPAERPREIPVHCAPAGVFDNWRELKAWDAEQARQRVIQWPWYYAASVIAARPK